MRHSTHVRATNNFHQRGAHCGLHNGKANEAKAEKHAQIYLLYEILDDNKSRVHQLSFLLK